MAGVAALLGLLALIGAAVFVWIGNPLASRSAAPAPTGSRLLAADAPAATSQQLAARALDTAGAAATPAASGANGVAPAGAAGVPTATRPNLQPANVSTLRHWTERAPGIGVDPALASRLDQVLAGVDGHVGIAVKDLGSGRGAVLEGDHEMAAASLYKLPVLYSVFEAGLSMGESLPITDEARLYDAGTMELGVGETLTVAEALERMVTLSDNTSAVMLGSRVGGIRINATLAALGMSETHYSLERMNTSALDMLQLLELIARGKAVSPAASSDMVHLLLRQRVNDRLPRLLPDEVQVAHKTGNLPGTVNDVGIVYGPSTTLAIAALVSDTADEAGATTAIARVAQVAYSYFEGQPEKANRPTIPPAPARAIPPTWRQPRPPPPPTPTPAPDLEETEPPAIAPVEPGTPTTTPSQLAPGLGTPRTAPTVAAAATTPAPGNNSAPGNATAPGSTGAPGNTSAPTARPTAAPAAATPVPPTATPAPPPPRPSPTTVPPTPGAAARTPTTAPAAPTRAPVASLAPTPSPARR